MMEDSCITCIWYNGKEICTLDFHRVAFPVIACGNYEPKLVRRIKMSNKIYPSIPTREDLINESIELKKMYRKLKIDNLRLSEINSGLEANIELYKNALMFEPLKTWADDYIDNGADDFVECMSERERDFAREFINQLREYVREMSDPIEEIEERNLHDIIQEARDSK
jgi:hypothetical protein